MASTFDNDLRLEEMATGENAGSWGTKTNTNLELIADAFGYGTFTIADADTTLTIPDGSGSDNALRSLYLKISSSADLTTTRVLTIDPNTVSKLWYIENNTSGGQTITISQGSGANINILNGQAKLVATDGAGAGAAVIDVTQDLAIPDLFIDDDLSLQSDGAIINFGEDADVSLTHVADTGLRLNDAMALEFRDGDLSINSSADGQLDIDADTEIEIVAPTVDIDASTAMTVDTTTFTVTGNTVLDGDLTVDTDTLYVDSANNKVGIGNTSPDSTLELQNASSVPSISLGRTPYSSHGNLTIGGTATGHIASNTDEAGNSTVVVNASRLLLGNGEVTFERSANTTVGAARSWSEYMRIDPDGNVGIGISNPGSYDWSNTVDLVVGNTSGSSGLSIVTSSSAGGNIAFADGTTGDERYRGYIYYDHSDDSMGLWTAANEKLEITSDGTVSIKDTANNEPTLKLETGTAANFMSISRDSATGHYSFSSDETGSSFIFALDNGSGPTNRFEIDRYGNVGIGNDITEYWSLGKAIHINDAANCMWGEGNYAFHMIQNAYYNAGWKYSRTDESSLYTQFSGQHVWYKAASGTADTAISWSESARLTDGGSFGVGTSSPSSKIEAYSSVSVSSASNEDVLTVTAVDNDGGYFYAGLGAGVAFKSGKITPTVKGPEVMGAIYGANTSDESVDNGYLTFHTRTSGTLGEKVRIENSGDVGINVIDPVVKLHVKDPDSVVAGLQSDATYAWLAFDASGTSGSVLDANVGIGANGNDLKFRSGGATRLTLDATGNLVFPNGNGIDFSASEGGGASSSVLDDYEEGTWTPVVQGSSTNGSYTYSNGYGYYEKIGRQVTIYFQCNNITEVSAGSGYIQITGVPFVKSAGHVAYGSCDLSNLDWGASGTCGNLQFITASATSILYIRINGDNYIGQDLNVNAISTGTSDISGTITYID